MTDDALLAKITSDRYAFKEAIQDDLKTMNAFPLTIVRPILEKHLAQARKEDCDCDEFQDIALRWLIKRERVAATPLVLRFREKNLAWRRGFLLSAAKALKTDALPILDAFLTPDSFFKGTYDQIPREEFALDLANEMIVLGADKKTMQAIAARFTKAPAIANAIARAISGGGKKQPTLKELSSPTAIGTKTWESDITAALGLDRSDWEGKRKRLSEFSKRVLLLPAALAHPAWHKLVRLVIDQTVPFKEYSKEIHGKAVAAIDDESGLIETYTDEGMCTVDLVFPVLQYADALRHPQWPALVQHALKTKFDALGEMSNGQDACVRLMKQAEGHAQYATLLKVAMKTYPRARWSQKAK